MSPTPRAMIVLPSLRREHRVREKVVGSHSLGQLSRSTFIKEVSGGHNSTPITEHDETTPSSSSSSPTSSAPRASIPTGFSMLSLTRLQKLDSNRDSIAAYSSMDEKGHRGHGGKRENVVDDKIQLIFTKASPTNGGGDVISALFEDEEPTQDLPRVTGKCVRMMPLVTLMRAARLQECDVR
uniref:Integrase core domain containing protein n=1 Tax=Solanum tuberosum TaxID=4113 RepID=M1DV77_SOLTU